MVVSISSITIATTQAKMMPTTTPINVFCTLLGEIGDEGVDASRMVPILPYGK